MPILDPEAAKAPSRPPLRGARFVMRLVVTTLLGGLWLGQAQSAILDPASRGQRGLVSLVLVVLGVPSLYLLPALVRRIWWVQLHSRWFVALFLAAAVAGAPLLAGLVDDWGNARELAGVRAQLQPLIAALEKEQAILGHPTLDLQPFLALHLADPRGPYLRTRFSYRPGPQDFGLAVGVTPRHRDASSWAYRPPDGRWTWLDLAGYGENGLPALEGRSACTCSFYDRWVCEPPCGLGLAGEDGPADVPSPSSPTASPAPTGSPR